MDHRNMRWETAGSLTPELEGAPRSGCHLRSPAPKAQSLKKTKPFQRSAPVAAAHRGDLGE